MNVKEIVHDYGFSEVPRISQKSTRDYFARFRITKEENEKIIQEAKDMDISYSSFMRGLIQFYFNNKNQSTK
jgi:hypothetical protein